MMQEVKGQRDKDKKRRNTVIYQIILLLPLQVILFKEFSDRRTSTDTNTSKKVKRKYKK
jgi:hypothetical protein